MAFITADRVLDSSTSIGTGAFVVSGTPAAGYQTFSAVMSVGDTCYYSIQGQTTSEWEVGLGTYSSANTLTRTTIYSSSNSGSAVTFSVGTKNVFITMAASKSPQLDPSGNVTALGTPASISLTNATNLPLATGVTGTLSANNGGSVAWQSVQTGNFTAVAGRAYPVNTTSAAITVTLPASPSAGNIVQLTDYAGTWTTNNVTVAPNGSNINGATANYTLNANRGSAAFVYIDATQGWVVYSAFALPKTNVYGISYLSVAGGGGGSAEGAGGAGGLLAGTSAVAVGAVYSVVVGAGGSGGTISANGGSGSTSSITVLASSVGGGGGGKDSTNGVAGGSGGGGGNGTTTGGAGTSGQGNSGGNGYYAGAAYFASGGGGGAGVNGGSATSTAGGSGGNGLTTTLITTTQATTYSVGQVSGGNVYFAGGGASGSGTNQGTAGAAGLGGGGTSGNNANGGAASANTGGGGGGASYGNTGGAGGSGVVIISIPTFFYSGTYTGTPTVVTNGANTVLIFKSSGSYTA